MCMGLWTGSSKSNRKEVMASLSKSLEVEEA